MENIRGSVGLNAHNDPFDVALVQRVLTLAGFNLGMLRIIPKNGDGRISPETIEAIRVFELEVMKAKKSDGRITPKDGTWARMLKEAGNPEIGPIGFPYKPDGVHQLGPGARDGIFSTFIINDEDDPNYPGYEDAPGPGKDKDNIKIIGGWEGRNIQSVEIPQLKTLGLPYKKRFHRLAVPQLLGLWQAWEDAGLLDRVLTFDGAHVPRYMRNTVHNQAHLSNHAWGTAFDINEATNKLRLTPAIMWEKGCVFELVPLAVKWGFFWGGWFGLDRIDGMHFEVRLITNHAL